jgi:hypothetical protein
MPTVGADREFPFIGGDIETAAPGTDEGANAEGHGSVVGRHARGGGVAAFGGGIAFRAKVVYHSCSAFQK